jgi:molybdate transport system substrate-binding protein
MRLNMEAAGQIIKPTRTVPSQSPFGQYAKRPIPFATSRRARYHYIQSIRELKMHSPLRVHVTAILLLCWLSSSPVQAGEVRVALASDFAVAMERLAPMFQKESGHTLQLTPGASGKLYAQIKKGAAFDVFLSADEELPKRLMQEGAAVAGSRFVYATGRLVLWSAQPGFVDDKGLVLNRGNFNLLAIPNPLYSPYGVAAKETLTKLTMWNAMQRKLDKGDDDVQTYQFAASERTELALIPLSQVMRDGKLGPGSAWIVLPELHNPIRQSAVLLSGAKDPAAAQAFFAFLKSEKAQKVMRGFGYEFR